MKLLVLGGSVFLGRYVVEAALSKGHEVTMFNRGQNNPTLFPEVEKLRGDRDGGLLALEGRCWDAVIDTCGYVPRIVSASASLLADQVEHYVFVSSISVYADFGQPGLDESAPVGTLKDEALERVDGKSYGPLKALCEQAATAAMPGWVCQVRAGLIVGPHDLSDRFTYWPRRVAQGGEVLAPADPDFQVQLIDVRDLAAWMVCMAETRQSGPFNVTGPQDPLTLGQVLVACKAVSGSEATLTWVDEAFLQQQDVEAWVALPLWMPTEMAGLMQVNCDKALEAGLTFRSLSETIRDTLDWDKMRPADTKYRAGLAREKEFELLKAWHDKG